VTPYGADVAFGGESGRRIFPASPVFENMWRLDSVAAGGLRLARENDQGATQGRYFVNA
jgi:hypothetical protein